MSKQINLRWKQIQPKNWFNLQHKYLIAKLKTGTSILCYWNLKQQTVATDYMKLLSDCSQKKIPNTTDAADKLHVLHVQC